MTDATTTLRAAAEQVVRTLRGAGHEALFAGGCVRDLLLGRRPKDYDVATDARPVQVRALFRRIVEVGVAFGVMRVRVGGHEVEVATFRTDLGYEDGRRPRAVEFTDAKADALRRDFTVNGMFLDPANGEVIDYVGGKADLAARLIRAVGDPEERFAEDRLRMLRAVRFATVLGFDVHPDTEAAIRKHASEIGVVSGERIRDELSKVLGHAGRAGGLRRLYDYRLLPGVLPEAAAEAPDAASAQALVSAMAALPADCGWETALAAMIRGGPKAFAGIGSADGLRAAAEARVPLAEAVCDRLAMTRHQRKLVAALVRGQWDLDFAGGLDLAGKKRLFARPEFPELTALRAAVAVHTPPPHSDAAETLALRQSLTEEQIRPAPLINGGDLLTMGIPAGPAVGRTLEAVYDAQLRGEVTEKPAALEMARRLNPTV